MNIDQLTIAEAKQLAAMFGTPMMHASKRLPMTVGTNVFIMTITAHFTGRVTAVSEEEVELTDAAWIASDGRFAQAMKTGEFDEVEPFPDHEKVALNRSTFLCWRTLASALPRSQK